MKVCVTSDTLGKLPKITGEYDIFIHAGDFAPLLGRDSHQAELERQSVWTEDFFLPWMKSIKARYKVFIPGQNDYVAHWFSKDLERHLSAMYLQDEATTIEGRVIYGMSWVSIDTKKYLNYDSDPLFVSPSKRHYLTALRKIPNETNVLITRIPPKNILDKKQDHNIGDEDVLASVHKMRNIKAHVFGLATDSAANKVNKDNVMFVNACIKDEVNSVVEFDI